VIERKVEEVNDIQSGEDVRCLGTGSKITTIKSTKYETATDILLGAKRDEIGSGLTRLCLSREIRLARKYLRNALQK
jgi:hypothetical protein